VRYRNYYMISNGLGGCNIGTYAFSFRVRFSKAGTSMAVGREGEGG